MNPSLRFLGWLSALVVLLGLTSPVSLARIASYDRVHLSARVAVLGSVSGAGPVGSNSLAQQNFVFVAYTHLF